MAFPILPDPQVIWNSMMNPPKPRTPEQQKADSKRLQAELDENRRVEMEKLARWKMEHALEKFKNSVGGKEMIDPSKRPNDISHQYGQRPSYLNVVR